MVQGTRSPARLHGSPVLDQVIYRFQDAQGTTRFDWTVRDACEGTQVFGATGSGKTTGSGYGIARGMLDDGFGGLVLTAKNEDREYWEEWAKTASPSRASDLVVVRPGGAAAHRFNFLDYEAKQGSGPSLTMNLVYLFSTAVQAGKERESFVDPYWTEALRQLLTNAFDLVSFAGSGKIALDRIAEAVRTAPRNVAEARSEGWQKGSRFFNDFIRKANERIPPNHPRRTDLKETLDYWGVEFAGLAEKTRSIIVNSFTAKATSLLRSPFREMFCSEQPPTFAPELTHRGKIIILDMPVKEFGEAGRFAQLLYKTVWQRATERRDEAASDARPVFLWADEAQYFITEHDMLFQQTARSKLAATVYLTQNLSNYYAALGGDRGRVAADSFLGNLQTKVFHANDDPATNEWAERLFGKHPRRRPTTTVNPAGWSPQYGHQALEPVVSAKSFTTLRKGGPRSGGKVEGIVFHSGASWHEPGAATTLEGLEDRPNVLFARFQQPSKPGV